LGVRDRLRQIYSQGGDNSKFLPLLFREEDAKWIPEPLGGASRYVLDRDYEALYRAISGLGGVGKAQTAAAPQPDVGDVG